MRQIERFSSNGALRGDSPLSAGAPRIEVKHSTNLSYVRAVYVGRRTATELDGARKKLQIVSRIHTLVEKTSKASYKGHC